jgi:hypothetical protein
MFSSKTKEIREGLHGVCLLDFFFFSKWAELDIMDFSASASSRTFF